MARGYLLFCEIDGPPEEAGGNDVRTDRLFDCVGSIADRDESPLGQLMWQEVYQRCRQAELSDIQAAIVDCWMRGCSDTQIADGLNNFCQTTEHTRLTIKTSREWALKKIRRIPHLGLPTVLVEIFGPKVTMTALSDESLEEYGFNSSV